MSGRAVAAKMAGVMKRLLSGQYIYLLPSGQWKFGGNKFVPDRVVRKLPIEEAYTANTGAVAFQLTAQAIEARRAATTGAVHESAVATPCAEKEVPNDRNS